jgi:aminoglycoside phosphotransferase (APT) family kinase protein
LRSRSACSSPRTVIHGELYPHNVLLTSDGVYPVDWETAAAAPGEIDVAALTEGWPEGLVTDFELEYRRARWGVAPPSDSRQAVDVARLYWLFRWLGDRPEWTGQRQISEVRFQTLGRIGRRLGLL